MAIVEALFGKRGPPPSSSAAGPRRGTRRLPSASAPDSPGKAKDSYFWVMLRQKEGVLFQFDPGRAHTVPVEMLDGFTGELQSDGFVAYETLAAKNHGLMRIACWAHARRKFVEAVDREGTAAAWYVAEIQRLYRIEAETREKGLDHEARAALRAERSFPLLASIKARLDAYRGRGRFMPTSPLAIAMNYTANLWPELNRYAEPGNGMIEPERSGDRLPQAARRVSVANQIGRVGSRRGDRRRELAAKGFQRKPGASFSSAVPFPAPARRTGRAAFPHPALISDFLAFAFNRSTRLPASPMRPSFS
jgi:hypothetical protein